MAMEGDNTIDHHTVTLTLIQDDGTDHSILKRIKQSSSDIGHLHVFAVFVRFLGDIASTPSGFPVLWFVDKTGRV